MVRQRIRWYHVAGLAVLVVVTAGLVWFWLERRRTAALRAEDKTDLAGGAE